MSERFTVVLPDDLARKAHALAAASNRRLEEAVVEWISRAVEEPPVEAMADDALLNLCDATLAPEQQEPLSELLARSREGTLTGPEGDYLDRLMAGYRRGLVRKAAAWREAVARGLRPPPIDDHAA